MRKVCCRCDECDITREPLCCHMTEPGVYLCSCGQTMKLVLVEVVEKCLRKRKPNLHLKPWLDEPARKQRRFHGVNAPNPWSGMNGDVYSVCGFNQKRFHYDTLDLES